MGVWINGRVLVRRRVSKVSKRTEWKYPEAIVDCEWLRDRIENPNIRIYDCTTYLNYTDEDPLKPYDVVSGRSQYEKGHIPKAAFLDLQRDLSDSSSPYKFTLPDYEKLAETIKNKGIGDPYHIILYSGNGIQWATRIWWMIYVLGYGKVSVLDGGFSEWQRLSLPIEYGSNMFAPANFEVHFNPKIFVGKDEVLSAIGNQKHCLINSLTEDIHLGLNPRYGRRGSIRRSVSIPFNGLLNTETGKLKRPEEVLEIYQSHAVFPDSRIISYCGGGIAASLDAFMLRQLGFEHLQIYDNSLSEWAMSEDLPMEIG